MATLGIMLGQALGTVAGNHAELIGGFVLIAIGVTIVHDHVAH